MTNGRSLGTFQKVKPFPTSRALARKVGSLLFILQKDSQNCYEHRLLVAQTKVVSSVRLRIYPQFLQT